MTSFKKSRLFAFILSVVLSLTIVFVPSVSAEESFVTANTLNELIGHIGSGAKIIKITADFEIDKPVYITSEVSIFADEPHTLTRNVNYGGDLFVVGTDAENNNPIFEFKKSTLTLGKAGTTETTLTIDGNSENMTVEVCGSAVYIINSAVVDMYDDVKITNCVKTQNDRTVNLDSDRVSSPTYAGGSAVIIGNGAFNMRGGIIENCGVRTSSSDSISYYGGAIYNNGTFHMYDGTIRNCSAYRGGAVFNNRIVKIFGGTLDSNYAAQGGAIFLSGTQTAELYIGSTTDADPNTYGIKFLNNYATTGTGGALYSYYNSPIVIHGDTLFDGNYSKKNSGGAIYTSGTLSIYKSKFTNNEAAYYGGAIYHFYAGDPDAEDVLTVRQMYVRDTVFDSNVALRGGAAAFSASNDNAPGANATFLYCTLTNNKANAVIKENPVLDADGNPTYDENGNPVVTTSVSYGQGGALYLTNRSQVIFSGSTATGNTAGNMGGAVAANGGSTFKVSGSTFDKNTSLGGYGGAVCIYESSTFTSSSGVYKNNLCEDGNGGAIYIAGGTTTFTNNLTITGNKGALGGGIYAKSATITIPKGTIKNNTAINNGGAFYLTSSVNLTLNNATLQGNSAYRAGAIHLGSSCTLNSTSTAFTSNTSTDHSGAMYIGSNASANLDKATFTSNVASNSSGGAIYTEESNAVNITNSSFTGNEASTNGGAVLLGSGSVSFNVSNTTFDSNKALTGDGGALYLYSRKKDDSVVLTDCAFTANNSIDSGGAMYIVGGTHVVLNNLTAKTNKAKYGGIVYITSANSALKINGATISGNTVTSKYPNFYSANASVVITVDEDSLTDLDSATSKWTDVIKGTYSAINYI